MSDEIYAFTNNPKELTLTGFTFMKEKKPDDFEVCLVIEITGRLSAGCWITDSKGEGCFRQGRGGVFDADYVLAWFPLEKVFIEKNIEWDPEYHLITEFYGLRVYAKDTESMLTFEYTGGNEKTVFHMDINTGNILENENMIGYEDLKYIRHVLENWYDIFKDKLLNDYRNGGYNTLPDYEEGE